MRPPLPTKNAFQRFLTSSYFHRATMLAAGLMTYPLVLALVGIVWKGGWEAANQDKQLDILGIISVGIIAILGLILVGIMGIVRSIKATLPTGASVDIDITDEVDKKEVTVAAEEAKADS